MKVTGKFKERTTTANDYFALLEGPHDHKQHINQQCGLDRYVRVLNLRTGEECHKKLYENTKGLHFKHTGYPPMYLHEMTRTLTFVPFQYRFEVGADDEG